LVSVRDATGVARTVLRATLLSLLLAAPQGFAQQADTFDAEWSRITSGGQTSTSNNGEFSAEGVIGVPEGSADPASADVYSVDSGFVAGLIPPGVTLRADRVFVDSYE
jgi:hypothetical protein